MVNMNNSGCCGRLIVTGGLGFIRSIVLPHLLSSSSDVIFNIDSMTYAGNSGFSLVTA